MPVVAIQTIEDYKNSIKCNKNTIIIFSADWAEQCKQVENVLEELATSLGEHQVQIVTIDAEKFADISAKHQIDAVPTVIYFNKGSAVDRVDGVDIPKISAKAREFYAKTNSAVFNAQTLEERLKQLINRAPLMIFMKGSRDAPRCGFSKQLIAIINETKLPYETFDILQDEEVRQGLKTFSDWPTYPQVYVKGELIGGLDIIKELQANNELESSLRG